LSVADLICVRTLVEYVCVMIFCMKNLFSYSKFGMLKDDEIVF